MNNLLNINTAINTSRHNTSPSLKLRKIMNSHTPTVVCTVCTFAYPKDNSTCDMCSTPNTVYEEMIKAMVWPSVNREDEELAKAIAAIDLRDLRERKDREEENEEKSMRLVLQLKEEHSHKGSHYRVCSNCSTENLAERVQCISCSVELDEKERNLAPGVVSREQIGLGPLVYDNGGRPDTKLLSVLGFFGKTGNACMVNAAAFVVNEVPLSPKDMSNLSARVTKDCNANPGESMWSDLLGVWFQELDLKVNILYGPTKPLGKFQCWASLRKFNPELRTFIIGNTGSHYAVYSPK